MLKYLAQRGHTITLITFIRPEEQPYLDTVRKVCHRVLTVPIKRSRLKDAVYFIRSQLTRQPFLVERDDSAAMRTLVREVIAADPVDVIHADQLTMAQFAPPYRNGNGKPALIFDVHNAVWTIVERLKATLPIYYSLPLVFEAGRVKAYEARIVHEFDHTLAVAEPDAQALREAVREQYPAVPAEEARITVIPIGVDTEVPNQFQPRAGTFNILTMGTLYYPPNADGIRWFLVDVFPMIRQALPQAKLTIVGKSPPADFLQAAKESDGSVAVTGYVPDLDPYFSEASVVIIPVRAGGGMRVRTACLLSPPLWVWKAFGPSLDRTCWLPIRLPSLRERRSACFRMESYRHGCLGMADAWQKTSTTGRWSLATREGLSVACVK